MTHLLIKSDLPQLSEGRNLEWMKKLAKNRRYNNQVHSSQMMKMKMTMITATKWKTVKMKTTVNNQSIL